MTYKEFDERDIQAFEYETIINSDGKIIGTCELGKATIQLLNPNNNYSDFKDSWIHTIHGSFYIHNVEPVQEKINIRLDCYDIKYKLDTKYDSSKHNFPCTLKEWRNSIFDDCGVEYTDDYFPNYDLVLHSEPYIGDNPSNRQVISMIAEAGCSFIVVNNDIFSFKWFENTIVHEIKDWIELTSEKTYSKAINCVVLGRGDVEDNVYWPEEQAEPVEFRIDNNYILDPQNTTEEHDQRYDVIQSIYNRVNGFNYLVFNMRTQAVDNLLSISLGQKVRFIDIWENELETYVMTKKIKYLGGDFGNDDNYEISLSSLEIKETSTDLSYGSKIENKILDVSRKADKINGVIEDVVKEVDNQNEKIAKTTMEINNIQTMFQVTGGNNLIKNSVGLFSDNNELSSWITEENADIQYGEDNNLIGITTSGSKISIRNTKIKTKQDNITNLTLSTIKSLSYKIHQDEDVSTTILLYGLDKNNPLYEKTFVGEMDWQEIYIEAESKFFVDSPILTLEIESTSIYDGRFEISDLMLNDGDKQNWTPATGEVWGEIVKLNNQGVSVYSLQGGIATLMASQGFQVRELYAGELGKIITQLTKQGLITIDFEMSGKFVQKNYIRDAISYHGYETYIEYLKGGGI